MGLMQGRRFQALVCGAASVALCLFGCGQPPTETQPVHDSLDALLNDLHQNGDFDGALVAGRGETVLYSKGFGSANIEADVPWTPRTPSDGASIAKTLTAAATLLLQQDGKLDLEEPVQQHLTAYPYPGATVGHLISHQTGELPDYDYFFEKIGPEEPLTNERLLSILAEHQPPLQHPPGTFFAYDDRGFDLAALLVERLSGQTFEIFLRQRILAPLGIETLFARPAFFTAWPSARTLSYRREAGSLVLHDVWDREGFHGGSNLYLSADDLYRWVTSFYTRPVLDEAILNRGLSPVALADGRETAIRLLSWYTDDTGQRFHYSGVIRGFYSFGYWDIEHGHSFAFVTNTNMPQALRPRLAAAVAEILTTGQPVEITLPTDDALLNDGYPRDVAGTYELEGLGTAHFTVEGDDLVARLGTSLPYKPFKVAPETLYIPGLDAWVTFSQADAGGRFGRLRWTTVFDEATGPRVD